MTFPFNNKNKYIATSPAKIILFGEHSVLYGSKCISIAIKKHGKVNSIPGKGKIICKDSTGKMAVLNEVLDFKFVNSDVIIELEMPMGSGLGTSAITCLLISAMISVNDNDPPYQKEKVHEGLSVLTRRAINLEHVFHGKSSGTDVITSLFGGLICYQDKLVRRMDDSHITKYKIIVWNSGIQKKTSDSCKLKTNTHKKLYDIAEEAYEILSDSFTLKEFYDLVRRSQDCLEELVKVPEEMKTEIRRLRRFNIESKISGSGNGGHLVTLINKDENVNGWEEVEIDYEGFHFMK
ncbi:hypothetical protein H312_03433 [Anncaliia algerae PRA339]|uniref:GHMP kinase N-terminal domain-containing protein n=1 Tax=Anncaliia algerae PRA339 TaxID=1288291 RepID=A0A059EWR6_9MICR|nr:hypothetical protein H312_03433 [Anncaliia algerae PRA339]